MHPTEKLIKGGESRGIRWMKERAARMPHYKAMGVPELKDTFRFLGGNAGNGKGALSKALTVGGIHRKMKRPTREILLS